MNGYLDSVPALILLKINWGESHSEPMGSSDRAHGLQWPSPSLSTRLRAHSGPGDSGSQCPVPLLASASTVAPLWLCSSHTGLLTSLSLSVPFPSASLFVLPAFQKALLPDVCIACTFTPCRALLKPHLLGEPSPNTTSKTPAPHLPSILPPAVSPYSA